MSFRPIFLAFALLAAATPFARRPCYAETSSPAVAFVDVSIVATDRGEIIAHQTVVLRGDRIISVGPSAAARLPRKVLVIDGRHRYLIPGITDFHIHMPDGQQDQEDELKLFISNGITTAVNMHGTPEILALRERIRKGEVIGPTLYSTGPYVNEPDFTTPDQVRRAVIEQKKMGYDFVKVHGELSEAAYIALIDTAREQHIRVVGHVPAKLGIDAVLGKHALIVHTEEFLYSYFQRGRDLPTDPQEIDRMVKEISEKTARSGTLVSPTLAVFHEIIDQVSDIDAVLRRPEMRYLPPTVTDSWQPAKNPYVQRWKVEKIPYFRAQYAIMQKLTKGLADAGVPLLVGTDPLVPGVIPGFSMQDEMNDMMGAGLTTSQVLRAATLNAALFLGITDSYGTVAAGKRGDLVLLEANPLEDITNVSRRSGVMLHGRWQTEDELQHGLIEMSAAYQHAESRRRR